MFTDALIRGQDSDFQRAIAYYQTEEGGGLSLAEAKKKAYLDAIGQVALAGLGAFPAADACFLAVCFVLAILI